MTIKLNIVSKVLARDALEAGVWIHLNGPGVDPQPLYADREMKFPVRALVRSHRCDQMTQLNERLEKKTLGAGRKTKAQQKALEADLKKNEVPLRFCAVLVALQNHNDDHVIEYFTEDQLRDQPTVDAGVEGKPFAFNPDYDFIVGQVVDACYQEELFSPEAIALARAEEEAAARRAQEALAALDRVKAGSGNSPAPAGVAAAD